MIGIIDYGAGNVGSVARALEHLSLPFLISSSKKELSKTDRLIFPGVGSAKYGMERLNSLGLASFLKDFASSGKFLFGICLGFQILFEHSGEEGGTDCLGLLSGSVRKIEKTGDLKVPHMGFNSIRFTNGGSRLFEGIGNNSDFYFVHSYKIVPKESNIVRGVVDYGTEIPVAIEKKNIFGVQFHPEKSGEVGLKLLKNFSELR